MSGPEDLLELRSGGSQEWLITLVLPDTGGGNLEPSAFSVLDERPEATALRISGLTHQTFEQFVTDYGARFSAIEFWKCPRVSDLTPLEDLHDVEMISLYWNQRATGLWDLACTPRLRALRFEDFTRLHELDDLHRGRALEELVFGDAVWGTSTFSTLDPLAQLDGLRRLRFRPKRIDDARVQPLGRLTNLRELSIPFNLFTTEQIAWLCARLPETVKSDALAALLPLKSALELNGRARDTLLIGKRKPYLHSDTDAGRIRKHVEVFDGLVRAFKDDPTLEPH